MAGPRDSEFKPASTILKEDHNETENNQSMIENKEEIMEAPTPGSAIVQPNEEREQIFE